jgi:adenylate cyclase
LNSGIEHILTGPRIERRLAAILAADVVGYSRLMGADEFGTLQTLKAHRREVVDPAIAEHHGRIVKTTGDGMLVEFGSVVDAVNCAMSVQQSMRDRNNTIADPANRNGVPLIVFRIGINVGDIIIDGDDIFGDGVNIAARIEGIAEPGGISISEDAWRQVRGKVAVKFVDTSEQNLKNIARPVRVYQLDLVPKAASVAEASRPTLVPPDKPSIAVLSFTNMTGDADQDYLGDGIAEDIITMLSHSWSLFVIARNSSFTYKGRAVDVKQVGRELGVRYVLEGSVRLSGNRVRITAQLIDAETGNHLWAERYDRDLNDIFAVQDEITDTVAISIEPAIAKMEQHRAIRKPPGSLGAWEAYQRGLWHMSRIGVTENEAAKAFFRQAIDLDRDFAPAHAVLAMAIFQSFSLYQTSTLPEVIDQVLMTAQRAISLDPLHPGGHVCMGWVLFVQGDREGASAEVRQALAISPSSSVAHHLLGTVLLFSNSPRQGLEAFGESLRLDPHYPSRHVVLVQIAIAYYFLREYDAAVAAAKKAIRSFPEQPWSHRWLAAALGQAGRLEDAMQALQKAIALAPKSFDVSVRQRPASWQPEDYEHMLEGLRKAGWEG